MLLCGGGVAPGKTLATIRKAGDYLNFVTLELMKRSKSSVPSPRTLIYGFGPYRQFRDNVTEKILRRFPRRRWLTKIVFPVRFHKKQFEAAVEKYRPKIILGLGQCSRGQYLRIETQALNRRRNSRKEKPRPIIPGGTPRLMTHLQLNCGRLARSSINAGDFVCNYSMYVILHYLKHHRIPARFCFVHIPHRREPKAAARILLKSLERLGSPG